MINKKQIFELEAMLRKLRRMEKKMIDEDFNKNMSKMFFRLGNAFRDVRDNMIENFGRENNTSELLFRLEEVCDIMIERYEEEEND